MDTKKLDAKVLKTYWNIDKAITKALPDPLKDIFAVYSFLVLFTAEKQHTELGISEVKRILKKCQKLGLA